MRTPTQLIQDNGRGMTAEEFISLEEEFQAAQDYENRCDDKRERDMAIRRQIDCERLQKGWLRHP